MAQIVAWNDISFALGGTSINGVEDIEITGSCETEDTESGGEKYVKRKNGKPYEIEMKAILDAQLGVNVQSMAIKMTEAARCSTSGYFYTGSAKLFPCSFMMVEASIGEIEINPQGVWTHCEVKLKLKQSTLFAGPSAAPASSGGGSSSGSSGGSSGGSSSSKKTSTKSTTTKKTTSSDVDAVSMAAPTVKQVISSTPVSSPTYSNPIASASKSVSIFVSTVKSSSAFKSSSSSSSSSSKVALPQKK